MLCLSKADKMPTKKLFISKFFALLLLSVHFLSVFIDKKSKKSKNSGTQGFSYFFACWRKDPDPDVDPYKIMTNPHPGGPKNKRILRIHNTDRGISMVPSEAYFPNSYDIFTSTKGGGALLAS
jgi:hypothetical protein